jgi:hypothetical protein
MKSFFLLAFVILPGITVSQQKLDTVRQIYRLLDSVFSSGKRTYQLVRLPMINDTVYAFKPNADSVVRDHRLTHFIDSFYKAAGFSVPYDERMGVTKTEYEQFRHNDTSKLSPNIQITGLVSIQNKNGLIRFKTSRGYPYLDSVSIDLAQNYMIFQGDTLEFAGAASTIEKIETAWSWALWSHTRRDLSNRQPPSPAISKSITFFPNIYGHSRLMLEYSESNGGFWPSKFYLLILELSNTTW